MEAYIFVITGQDPDKMTEKEFCKAFARLLFAANHPFKMKYYVTQVE